VYDIEQVRLTATVLVATAGVVVPVMVSEELVAVTFSSIGVVVPTSDIDGEPEPVLLNSGVEVSMALLGELVGLDKVSSKVVVAADVVASEVVAPEDVPSVEVPAPVCVVAESVVLAAAPESPLDEVTALESELVASVVVLVEIALEIAVVAPITAMNVATRSAAPVFILLMLPETFIRR
jgi:hypothetical protein